MSMGVINRSSNIGAKSFCSIFGQFGVVPAELRLQSYELFTSSIEMQVSSSSGLLQTRRMMSENMPPQRDTVGHKSLHRLRAPSVNSFASSGIQLMCWLAVTEKSL